MQPNKTVLEPNKVVFELQDEQFSETAHEIEQKKLLLENCLDTNSLEGKFFEFFSEIAALKGKNVKDILLETIEGAQKYIEAVSINVEFVNDIPTDINKYCEKMTKLAIGIENCWDIFSPESQSFFINLAYNFSQTNFRFEGWKSLITRFKLLLPSIKHKDNLYKKYRDSSLLLPEIVAKVLEIRKIKSKITSSLRKKQDSLFITELSAPSYLTKTKESWDDLIEFIDEQLEDNSEYNPELHNLIEESLEKSEMLF